MKVMMRETQVELKHQSRPQHTNQVTDPVPQNRETNMRFTHINAGIWCVLGSFRNIRITNVEWHSFFIIAVVF